MLATCWEALVRTGFESRWGGISDGIVDGSDKSIWKLLDFFFQRYNIANRKNRTKTWIMSKYLSLIDLGTIHFFLCKVRKRSSYPNHWILSHSMLQSMVANVPYWHSTLYTNLSLLCTWQGSLYYLLFYTFIQLLYFLTLILLYVNTMKSWIINLGHILGTYNQCIILVQLLKQHVDMYNIYQE